jgi:hypothetical protein
MESAFMMHAERTAFNKYAQVHPTCTLRHAAVAALTGLVHAWSPHTKPIYIFSSPRRVMRMR